MKTIQEVLAASYIDKEAFDVLMRHAGRAKPGGLDTASEGIAARFSGDQVGILKAALQQRFPRTHMRFPCAPVNWLRFFASQDAGVYTAPASRVASQDQELFDTLAKQLGLDALMAEVELRAVSGVHTVAVLLGWQSVAPVDGSTLPFGQIYWPHQIDVVADPTAPEQQEALLAVILHQRDDHWVWTRQKTETGYTPWQHGRYDEDDEVATLVPYAGVRLPIVFLRLGQPCGFFASANAEVCAQVDALNVSKANESYIVEMQAHSQLVLRGRSTQAHEIAVGPDEILQVGENESIDVLSYGADITALQASRALALREIAVSREASPDSYSPTSAVPQSGLSRLVANIPHDRALDRMRPTYELFEERYLLPLLLEVGRVFGDVPFTEGTTIDVSYRSESYELPSEKQNRLLTLLDRKLLSPADVAVQLGVHPNIEAAQAAGLSSALSPTSALDALLPLGSTVTP